MLKVGPRKWGTVTRSRPKTGGDIDKVMQSVSKRARYVPRPIHLTMAKTFVKKVGGHSIAPKTASANAANAKVRNRQMIGRSIIL